jgi:hypothetical protein
MRPRSPRNAGTFLTREKRRGEAPRTLVLRQLVEEVIAARMGGAIVTGGKGDTEMAEPACPRCGQLMSSNDTVAFAGDQIVHLDCRRPRELNHEERALLFRFCWDHVVAECGTCRQSFRQHELAADLLEHRTHLCPRCRADLTANMREHLFACQHVPTEVRWRAEDARDAARRLIKERQELSDRADALMRAAELAIAALRETMQRVM